jgi:UDP-2-acetamido-2-deoxy-ribo-hexuluronate aminotransferase
MQFIDLQKQYRQLKNEIDESICNVLNSSNYIMGKQVSELEENLAEYVGMKHCITCGNGTDALILALKAYNIKQGDAVFVPTFTFYATAEAVSICGATPIFVDIEKDTFNMSPEDLEAAIKETVEDDKLNPRAIITVDLFGIPCNYEKIKDISEKYNLLLIEDGAQGFGGSVNGKMACSFGDISTTSFFPAKPLGCYGDGGAIFTNEDKVKEYLSSLKVHGRGNDKYDNVRIGMNSRLDTIQAAILLPKLKAFKEYELDVRNRVAKMYNENLNHVVRIPHIPKGYVSSYAQYSILFESEIQRDKIQKKLAENDIPTMIYYKKSMHQQSVYRNNISIYRGFSNAEEISNRILSLPMHPYLEDNEINNICAVITDNL